MTKIAIDPEELSVASTTLQQCAVELADIGSELTACIGCPMPPEVAQVVTTLVATVDAILDRLGAVLHTEAVGLASRSVLAALDSIAAASGSTRALAATQAGIDLATLGGMTPTRASGFVGGTMSSGLSISSTPGPTRSPSATEAAVSGLGTIGGSWSPDGAGITIIEGPPVGPSSVRIPADGGLAHQMAIDIGNSSASHQALGFTRYGEYATHETQAGRDPRPSYDYPG